MILSEVNMMLPEVNVWGLGVLGYEFGVLPEVDVPDGVKARVGAGEGCFGERRPHLKRILDYLFVFFFLSLVTGPRRSLLLKLSDTGVYVTILQESMRP